MVELLSPVGDFECLKAAVQNGADAVYFGSNLFSARAFAKNFDDNELKNAINYAKLRNVKTHLTLNTLIKDDEFNEAFSLAKKAYEYGIDAIIVQDLGLARILINKFPDLDIHASTQMTTTNLEGVQVLEHFGFKRVVLSRETSLEEIKHICQNTNIEIEVFMHGALCISYSGQCLFSSMVGGRSGNRGQCAQPCRLPYELHETSHLNQNDTNSKVLDKGYLLSTKDLCTLDFLPELIKSGVKSFKIEGRMKSPTYVATVTRIYRKYIDLAVKFNNNDIPKYEIDNNDKKELMQVFNRGGFSSGHISSAPNKDLIFKTKPNNMGLYLGRIINYNKNKGHVTVKLAENVSIGDSISFENEPTKYTISELMLKNQNLKTAVPFQIVTLGRMKGNIRVGDKIYKISDKQLSNISQNSFSKEFKTTPLYCKLDIHANKKISVFVKSLIFNVELDFSYDYLPLIAENSPITKEKILSQFNKTLNTCFTFSKIDINIDDNLFIPTSIINEIRRQTISKITDKILSNFERHSSEILQNSEEPSISTPILQKKSLLLNILNKDLNYNDLKPVDRIYIPLKYFVDTNFKDVINVLSKKAKLYIYMPNIIKDAYVPTISESLRSAINNYNIFGIVVSNLSELLIINNSISSNKLDLVANYTMNLYNSYTANELFTNFNTVTPSLELKDENLKNFIENNKSKKIELIVNGFIPLMATSYCFLGNSNKCYENCSHKCMSNNSFFLKDRYNFNFRIIPDNLQTITTIYSSRKINIDYKSLPCFSTRFDILDEDISEINMML